MLSKVIFGRVIVLLVNVKKSKSQNEQKRPELFVILVPHICTCVECTERYVRMVETFCHKLGM
jgi:hypothetical protein